VCTWACLRPHCPPSACKDASLGGRSERLEVGLLDHVGRTRVRIHRSAGVGPAPAYGWGSRRGKSKAEHPMGVALLLLCSCSAAAQLLLCCCSAAPPAQSFTAQQSHRDVPEEGRKEGGKDDACCWDCGMSWHVTYVQNQGIRTIFVPYSSCPYSRRGKGTMKVM
jgi:hypothetical protein